VDGKRKVPPLLGDWCRSQSFPPPQKSAEDSDKKETQSDDKSVFGGRPLSKDFCSTVSSVSGQSDIEGKVNIHHLIWNEFDLRDTNYFACLCLSNYCLGVNIFHIRSQSFGIPNGRIRPTVLINIP